MLVFLLNNELSLFPVMHLLFQWWLFMLNMGKVSNTEVSLCTSNPCELKARPYTALNTQLYTVVFYHCTYVMSERGYTQLLHQEAQIIIHSSLFSLATLLPLLDFSEISCLSFSSVINFVPTRDERQG